MNYDTASTEKDIGQLLWPEKYIRFLPTGLTLCLLKSVCLVVVIFRGGGKKSTENIISIRTFNYNVFCIKSVPLL